MRGAGGGICHACSNRSVVLWRDIWASHSGIIILPERLGQVAEPIRIGICVVIYVGDNPAIRRLPSDISGMAQAMVRRADKLDVVLGCDRRCIIHRPIVDDDHLEVRIANLGDSLQTFANGSTSVETPNHYRNSRPGQIKEKYRFGKGAAYHRK